MNDAQDFPLDWPANRPRTPATLRKYGKFKTQTDGGWMSKVTVAAAHSRLISEVARIAGLYPVLSSNLPTTRDGRPRPDTRPVDGEVGVCLYFVLKGQPIALACDTYTDVAQNIAALAAHLEATRAIERHGVATAAETLQAFAALPPPEKPKAKWWEVFGLMREKATLADVEALYRAKARAANGSEAAMYELNAAREDARREFDAVQTKSLQYQP